LSIYLQGNCQLREGRISNLIVLFYGLRDSLNKIPFSLLVLIRYQELNGKGPDDICAFVDLQGS